MQAININVNVMVDLSDGMRALLPSILGGFTEPEKAAVQEAPEATVQAAEERPAEAGERKYTEVDVRAAMEKTRARIEGEDYRTNTSSEAYKKYHRQLTGEFKRLAATLGADKPSELPEEKREAFITSCDDLYIDGDGNLAIKCPF